MLAHLKSKKWATFAPAGQSRYETSGLLLLYGLFINLKFMDSTFMKLFYMKLCQILKSYLKRVFRSKPTTGDMTTAKKKWNYEISLLSAQNFWLFKLSDLTYSKNQSEWTQNRTRQQLVSDKWTKHMEFSSTNGSQQQQQWIEAECK